MLTAHTASATMTARTIQPVVVMTLGTSPMSYYSAMRALLCRLLRAEPHELPALAWSFAYFFLLLAAYYLLRPVRDTLAVEAGKETLQWLFTATFVAMLALVPVFGWLAAR